VSGRRAARRGRAERLSFRGQFYQDETIALGAGMLVAVLAGTLHDARVISGSVDDWSLVGVVLPPFVVSYWHAGWRPVPPPPASRARRAVTVAASVVVVALLVAAVAAWAALVAGGRLGWSDFPLAAVTGAYLSLSAARRAARNWRPALPPVTPPGGSGAGAVEDGAVKVNGPSRVPVSVPPWGPAALPPGS